MLFRLLQLWSYLIVTNIPCEVIVGAKIVVSLPKVFQRSISHADNGGVTTMDHMLALLSQMRGDQFAGQIRQKLLSSQSIAGNILGSRKSSPSQIQVPTIWLSLQFIDKLKSVEHSQKIQLYFGGKKPVCAKMVKTKNCIVSLASLSTFQYPSLQTSCFY